MSQGYGATSLNEIAEAAGLTKGAVFFYFSSKEKLMLSLLDVVEANIADTLLERLARTEGDALEKVAAFFKHTSQAGVERPDELLCLIKISIEFQGRGDAIDKRTTAVYGRIYSTLVAILEEGRKRGEIDSSFPPAELASTMISTHDGMMLEWHRRAGVIDGRRLVRTVWTTFVRGIAADGHKSPHARPSQRQIGASSRPVRRPRLSNKK